MTGGTWIAFGAYGRAGQCIAQHVEEMPVIGQRARAEAPPDRAKDSRIVSLAMREVRSVRLEAAVCTRTRLVEGGGSDDRAHTHTHTNTRQLASQPAPTHRNRGPVLSLMSGKCEVKAGIVESGIGNQAGSDQLLAKPVAGMIDQMGIGLQGY